MLSKIIIPQNFNYIGVFLTLRCNLSCSYCINHLSGLNANRKILSGNQWVEGLSRFQSQLPFTLQGGEPTIHKDFYFIARNLSKNFELDLLTNLQFSPEKFVTEISPEVFNRNAPYSPIRISFHPETMDLENLVKKALYLRAHDYNLTIYTVEHPEHIEEIEYAEKIFYQNNLAYKRKEFLGTYKGKIYGTYLYQDAVFNQNLKNCLCKTSELLIDPYGDIFRCHHDLYNKLMPLGNILDENLMISEGFRACSFYGNCNPCDVKIKTNRHQEYGHTSVEILFPEDSLHYANL